MTIARLVELFLIGVATPLTAACVIPLYPAFVGYLASVGERARSPALLGALVVAGVLSFMALAGLLFATILESSVTVVVEVVSPIAFIVLAAIGLVLVVAPSGFARLPVVEPPHYRSPNRAAFGYGFFFGAIVIPCNPGLIALFFLRAPVLFDSFIGSMLGFLAFGLGIGAPLLALAVLSEAYSHRITRTLARYSAPINRVVGVVLVIVSAYYLVVVF